MKDTIGNEIHTVSSICLAKVKNNNTGKATVSQAHSYNAYGNINIGFLKRNLKVSVKTFYSSIQEHNLKCNNVGSHINEIYSINLCMCSKILLGGGDTYKYYDTAK